MKLSRFIMFSLLLCLVFPALSYADQLEDAKAAIQDEDFKKACELLGPLAEENNTEAQFLLGSLYANGQGVEKDETKSLSWIMEAAKQGHEEARRKAFSLLSDLARQGDTGAMYNLGYMCLNGWGEEQDPNECIKWLETAAEYGHLRSAKILSGIYTKGMFGITPDEEKASYWEKMPETFADGINGKWRATMSPPEGAPGFEMTLTYELEADGKKLEGTVTSPGPWGRADKIRDGKIQGNNVSFIVKSSGFGGMKMTTEYTGVLSGNVLILTYTSKSEAPRRRGAGIGTVRVGGGESPPVSLIAKRVL